MATYVNMDQLRFLLHEVHSMEDLFRLPRYSEFDKESIDILLDSAKAWADQDWYPFYRDMDEKPAFYKDGIVYSHPQVKKVMKDAGDNGWIGMYFDREHGGAQVPHTVVNAINHILEAANNHLTGYLGLTAGSAHLITTFGTQSLIDRFVAHMLAGKWAGTMCLTEPQAGSSLSDVKTMAYPQADGSYKIKGQKIFISGGDHEAADNFVHLVLARIEGAPAGTKGISLFVVPKYLDNEGEIGAYNDVLTAGDFQKMGQRGYSTVHLVFGENDNCLGWLVGEANAGLKQMFQMMNGARIDVGMTAASTATAAYYASLQYANERPQGRRMESNGRKNPNQEPALIIEHADVRRMLLKQKSIVEGAVSLLIETAKYADFYMAGEGEEKKENQLLLELLTPMAKTFPSERGKEAIDNGLQVLGGYGFCTDFILQQYYRDVRIMSLYEGTTGIQSLDLLGRKITMENGKALQLLMAKIKQTMAEAETYDELKPYVKKLEAGLADVQTVLAKLVPLAMSGEYELFLADATIFMDLASTVVIGYQWLKMGTAAKKALVTGTGSFDQNFYESKLHTMKYYFKYELPRTKACLDTLMNEEELTIVREEEESVII
ncbi:MAG: acyl-CoA dehydrogenase [Saprospiraceae bacterium]|nr:acyl-CoA dehydrogenase [Saprospiraceae bacterium]